MVILEKNLQTRIFFSIKPLQVVWTVTAYFLLGEQTTKRYRIYSNIYEGDGNVVLIQKLQGFVCISGSLELITCYPKARAGYPIETDANRPKIAQVLYYRHRYWSVGQERRTIEIFCDEHEAARLLYGGSHEIIP